jgi:V/A-type H+-transporting ATPase subunit E
LVAGNFLSFGGLMEGKVSQLAEKLLKEGVEQGEKKRDEIISEAKKHAEDIIESAKKQAEKIISEANEKAQDAKKNADSEIKLSGQQALSALKLKIADLILAKAIDASVSDTLTKNIPDYVKAVLSNWKGSDSSVEVLLSQEQKTALEKDVATAVKGIMKEGVTVSASKNVKSGFQIGESSGSYKVSFTDSDFAEYFKEYLRPKVKSILFGE